MRICLWAGAMAYVAVTASQDNAQDGPALAPIGPWKIDYDTDSCALRRMFGTGEDQVYLEIRRFGPTEGLQAIIGTGGMKARRTGAFRYRFDSDTKWREVKGANTLELANGFSGVLFFPTFVDLPELEEVEDLHQRAAYLESIDFPALEREAAARITRLTLRRVPEGADARAATLRHAHGGS